MKLCDDFDFYSSTVRNSDFNVNVMEFTVNFITGSMNGDSDCLTISILDDDDLEGDHVFTVSLDLPASPVTLTDPSSSPVTITDNDGKGHAWLWACYSINICQLEK